MATPLMRIVSVVVIAVTMQATSPIAVSDIVLLPEAKAIDLSSHERARLISQAQRFVDIMTNGSDEQVNQVVSRIYFAGLQDPYVQGLLFGPSEAVGNKGFREVLRAMSAVRIVIGESFEETSASGKKTKARVYFYDPKKISSSAVLSGEECSKHKSAYLSQLFEQINDGWSACCLLFEAETDAPCH